MLKKKKQHGNGLKLLLERNFLRKITKKLFIMELSYASKMPFIQESFFSLIVDWIWRLMNKLKPGSIPKIHTQGGPMKLRENIGLFQDAARAYGVSSSEVFQAVDCFDKKNIQQVTVSIFIRFLIEFCSSGGIFSYAFLL